MGETIRRRRAPHEARLAKSLFAAWWFGLAGTTAIGAARSLLGAFGFLDLALHESLVLVALLPLCVALWGLLYYLLFLYTGRKDILWPLSALYVLVYLSFVGLIVWLAPTGVEAGPSGVTLTYAREASGPVVWAILALLLGPIVVAAILYGSLYFRLKERSQRYRVGLVSSGFLVWFAAPAVAFVAGVADDAWWPVASRVIALVVPVVVLMAYKPPAWVRRRLLLADVAQGADAR